MSGFLRRAGDLICIAILKTSWELQLQVVAASKYCSYILIGYHH